jgi:4,5-DOPA dioxygenase extradiol
MARSMPALFVGHGNPLNSVRRNAWTEAWATLGTQLPLPRAVLCISAHWYVPSTRVTAMPAPRTIHDFGGFPPELYEIAYPAPGSAELAQRIQNLLAPVARVDLDLQWGLDHGSWSVLRHMYPGADIPVVQLSLDKTRPPEFHCEIGRCLSALRDEEVLIVGSGNIVHNLHSYAWGRHPAQPFDWALRFETQVRRRLLEGDAGALAAYESLGGDARLAVPTPEHFLPLLHVAALRRSNEGMSFPVEGIDGGSVSMLAVAVGI